jgi:hypothetical protein
MLANLLESLVLRGVSVLRDGRANGLCLGTSEANVPTPEVRISMRHPSLGYPQADANPRAGRPGPDAKRVADGVAFGAGRSRGRAGVLSRRSPATPAGGPATSWRPGQQGQVIRQSEPGLLTAWHRAKRGDQSLRRSSADTCRSPFTVATSFTAGAVLTSTRGKGDR